MLNPYCAFSLMFGIGFLWQGILMLNTRKVVSETNRWRMFAWTMMASSVYVGVIVGITELESVWGKAGYILGTAIIAWVLTFPERRGAPDVRGAAAARDPLRPYRPPFLGG